MQASQGTLENVGKGIPRRCLHLWPLEESPTFSVSSFLTDFRLALRSMETLCLEPSRALSIASAETRTRRSGGRLNFPLRSSTLIFRSLICRVRKGGGVGGHCMAALHTKLLFEAGVSGKTERQRGLYISCSHGDLLHQLSL